MREDLSPGAFHHRSNGSYEYPEIEQEVPVFNVEEIVAEFFKGCGFTGAVRVHDLSPSCDSGLHKVSQSVVRKLTGQLFDEFRPFRSRADERHVPFQHIEELRETINNRRTFSCFRLRMV